MKQRFAFLAAAVAALGVAGWFSLAPAEEPPLRLAPPGSDAPDTLSEEELAPPSGRDDMAAGQSLVERGAELFLRGLLEEIGPSLDDMQQGLGQAAEALGPKLGQFLALMDDVRNYQAPERLENGDILLRRVPGAPPPPPLLPPDGRRPPETAGPVAPIDL